MKPTRILSLLLLLGLLAILTPLAAEDKQKENPPTQQAEQNSQNAEPPAKVADPVAFTSKDGKVKGWKVVIPGNRPLATPAVVDGKVYVGGGFGSHEFYSFDAATGKKGWQYQTKDDGPTAAVVEDGYVAFNTESCELEIILAKDGKPVWKKWLGDPLMSMPAISKGKVYMAYPESKGDRNHHLACFDLKTGKEFWKKPIAGEIITAPVVAEEKVYLATLEGTLYCFGQYDGELVWKEKKNITSSPVVWNNKCYFSRREETTVVQKDGKKAKQQTEQVAGRGTGVKETVKDLTETARAADYLDLKKRAALSPTQKMQEGQDAAVGFGGAKGDAKIAQAEANLGQSTVSGIWAYQGSRPFIYKDQIFSAMGDTLKCVDPKTEKLLWKREFSEKKEKGKDLVDSSLTPPALVNDKIFMGTAKGDVLCLSAKTGDLLWKANIGEAVTFQPAVAGGRVFVSTNSGSLYCLETGDAKNDGWLMWGGNAGHNGGTK